MPARWCNHCKRIQPIEWGRDVAFGLHAESARCPACGAVWGVRYHRATGFAPTGSETDEDEGAVEVVRSTHGV